MAATGLRALTDAEAAEIIELEKTGKYSQRDLAKRFSVSQGTISNIVTSRFYVTEQRGHVKPEERLIRPTEAESVKLAV